jgi:hypothetical protein
VRSFALALVVVAAGTAATTVGARSSAFGLAPTKACLAKKGATFQTYPQPLPGLTAGEQSETMIGTLPAGGAPVFFYLVIGRNATQAQAILEKLRNSMAQAPTKANSSSGASQNAAWTMISILGAPPTAAVRTALTGCLKTGTAPTGAPTSPARYVRGTVGACLAGNGQSADVVTDSQEAFVAKFLFKYPLLVPLRPHTLIAITHTNANAKDGLTLILVFGSSPSNAADLRAKVRAALHLKSGLTAWSGSKKNVAWDGFREINASPTGFAHAKRLLSGCLP